MNGNYGLRSIRCNWLGVLVGTLLSTASAATAQMAVYSSGSVAINQQRQLSAYVPLSPNTITWSVNGAPNGNGTVGTIVTTGTNTATYKAPVSVPAPNAVKVRATSTAFPANYAEITITVTQPVPQLWSIYPTSTPTGPFTISLNGANYGSASVVNIAGVTVTTTYVNPTSLKASGITTASQAGTTLPVTVTNTGAGAVTTAAVKLSVTAAPQVTTSVTPPSASVSVTKTQQFGAAVMGSSNTAVTWGVNGIAGGNAVVGTISASGLYTAPAAVPSPANVAVQATSAANPSSVGVATVTILAALPAVNVTVSPSSGTVAPQAGLQFSATVTGNANTSVTWSVNGITGGTAALGFISGTGLYTAPAVIPNPAQVTIRAASVVNPGSGASAAVTIAGLPNPGTGQGTLSLKESRFLEQAAFGPTAADVAHLKQVGINGWLNEQFSLPETAITIPASQSSGAVQQDYLNRLSTGKDQLRQRVAYALSQIMVISMNKNYYPDEIVPYLQILSRNAFGNYRTLLWEISTSSQMGKYLDLANNNKPTAGSGANENYARELLQLFTIGLYELHPDGSPKLDAQGNPIYAYDQSTIQQVALALTGWTYPGPANNNWENFTGPLQPKDVNHDMRQKSFLGCTLPPNRTTVQDMNGVLDCAFNHPNLGPFLAQRLIRNMVTSNPSPGYVQRVAAVFNDNGSGVRGDLHSVVTAILTDAEARNDTATPNFGRLKDPLFHVISFTRALNGWINTPNTLSWEFSLTAQAPLTPPSVFGFYSPLYKIPKSGLSGPEFQIYSPSEAARRGNMFWRIITNPGSDYSVTVAPFSSAAANTPQLIDAVDQALLYGRMPQAMRQTLANAIAAQSDSASRWQIALYLTALSGLFAVQY